MASLRVIVRKLLLIFPLLRMVAPAYLDDKMGRIFAATLTSIMVITHLHY
jgi:hypothetical protein